MVFAEYLRRVNVVLEQMAAENQHSRSYIRLLRPYNEKKLNIIGSFAEALSLEGDSAMTFTPNARKSFGIVPTETFEGVRNMTLGQNSVFASAKLFEQHIEKHWRNFCVDQDEFKKCFSYAVQEHWIRVDGFDADLMDAYQKAFCKALYARCLLQASRASGFWILSPSEKSGDYVLLKRILENDTAAESREDKKSGLFRVCGRLQDCTLQALDVHFKFVITTFQNRMNVLKVLPRMHGHGSLFVNLYENENASAYTYSGSAIYSGVLPRLCRVEYLEPQMGNEEVQQMRLILGRTTYMTMYGLNKPDILAHPFLDAICETIRSPSGETFRLKLRELNLLFDLMEVRAQEEYWASMSHRNNGLNWRQETEEDFRICNDYLAHSWNIHNINISGNLITSDKYCVYTRRSQNVLDSGNLYCSVNGGCEVFDPQVGFYRSSVPEDLPTIQYGHNPVYFGGELTREAIGELGIGDISVFWNYYGLSVMGNSRKDGQDIRQVIWFHFNVLGERQCLDTFDSILESKKQAAESFESEEIFGYKMLPFSTIPKLLSWAIIAGIQRILENSDVLSFLVLAYAVHHGQAHLDLNNKLVGMVGGLAVIFIIYKCFAFISSLKTRQTVVSWQNRRRIRFEKLLRGTILGRTKQKDPIFLALTALRFMRVFRSS